MPLCRSAARPRKIGFGGLTTALAAPATALGGLTTASGERLVAFCASDLRPPLQRGEGAESGLGLLLRLGGRGLLEGI